MIGRTDASPPEPAEPRLAGGVDDDAGAEEQGCLVERMRQDEADGRHRRDLALETDQHGDGAQRGHGREGQHRLEGRRAQGLKRGDQHGRAPEGDQRRAEPGGLAEDRRHRGEQEHAQLHHGGGMQIGRGRGRCGHGVGQPEMERHLRGFGEGARHHQDDDRAEERALRQRGGIRHQRIDGEGIRRHPDQDDAGEQRQPAADRDKHGLQGRLAGGKLGRIEPDQQEGEQARHLPEDEQGHQVVGGHRGEHRAHEEQDVEQELRPGEGWFLVHVGGGIERHEGADAADQQGEQQREPVEPDREIDPQSGHPRVSPR